jgi:hypothetical protein
MSQASSPSTQKRTPSNVSKIIERGTNAYIGILRDSPDCVLKWPHSNFDALKSFESEKRALTLLGRNRYIVQLLEISERGLRFEYHPNQSIRHFYRHRGLPSLDYRYRWCHQAVSGFAYIGTQHPFVLRFGCENLRLRFCRTARGGSPWTSRVSVQFWTNILGLGGDISV